MAYVPFWPVPAKKFVIFGQGRTGSTLLVELLNTAKDTHCDKEIFNIFHFTGERISNPATYVKGRSKRFFDKVYGFKVKIYQLENDHKVESVRDFLSVLIHQGYKIIYLNRDNVVQHAYSNVKRSTTGVTHVHKKLNEKQKITISAAQLMKEILTRIRLKEVEREVLEGLDYLQISYESDLLDGSFHLQTVNRIRGYLGLSLLTSVSSKLQKITDRSLADEITNYDEVMFALKKEKLDGLVW
jgi:LPS sulfotransferase NodH